jgi:uncharacterized membrane protein YfcA
MGFMMTEATQLGLTMLLVVVGAFVQTGIGFGLAVVIAPLLFVINPDLIPAPLCLLVLLVSLVNAVQQQAELRLGDLKMAMLGRIPGSMVGGLMLLIFSQQTLELYLGCLVLLAVGVSFSSLHVQPTAVKMSVAGFFSGVFGTSAAIGGPPMALLLQNEQAQALRANLAAFFVLSSVISLIVQTFTGHFTLKHLWLTLPMIPAALLGQWVAKRCCQRLDPKNLRAPILLLCALSGLTAVWHGLGGYR